MLFLGHKNLILNKQEISRKINFKINKKIKKIFIFFGSSDNSNETLKILKTIKNFKELKFLIVVGNLNKKYKKIIFETKKYNNISLYWNLTNSQIIKLIKVADLGIGAGGINMIERLYFGLPSLVISTASNQMNGINYLKNNGKIIYLGKNTKLKSINIENSIKEIIYNRNKYSKLKKKTINTSNNLRLKNNFFKKIDKILSNN